MVRVTVASVPLPDFLEIHQLLSGREFAKVDSNSNPNPKHANNNNSTTIQKTGTGQQTPPEAVLAFATQMANYVYAIVDRRDDSAVLVDPCWDVGGIFRHLHAAIGATRIAAVV